MAVTPEMNALLIADLDRSLSPYLGAAADYCSQWWNPPPGEIPGVLSPEELRIAMDYHLAVLGYGRPSTGVLHGPFPAQGSVKPDDSAHPTVRIGRPTTCKRCMPYRKLLEEASCALMETTNHLNAVYQFVEFSTASADRRTAGMRTLGAQAIRLQRALEDEDIDFLVGAHPPEEESMKMGSDYMSGLPSGIDWNKVTTDYRLSVSGGRDAGLATDNPSQIVKGAPIGPSDSNPAEQTLNSGHPPTLDKVQALPIVGPTPDIQSWLTSVVGGPPEGPNFPAVKNLSAPPKLGPTALGSIFVASRPASTSHIPTAIPKISERYSSGPVTLHSIPPATEKPASIGQHSVLPSAVAEARPLAAPMSITHTTPANDASCVRRSPTLVSMDGLEDDDEEPPMVEA